MLAELRDGQALRFSHFFVCFVAHAVYASSLDLTHSEERALCEQAAASASPSEQQQSDQLDRARMLMCVRLRVQVFVLNTSIIFILFQNQALIGLIAHLRYSRLYCTLIPHKHNE